MYCDWHLDYMNEDIKCKKKIKNGLNSEKVKHCKNKIVWNDLENN